MRRNVGHPAGSSRGAHGGLHGRPSAPALTRRISGGLLCGLLVLGTGACDSSPSSSSASSASPASSSRGASSPAATPSGTPASPAPPRPTAAPLPGGTPVLPAIPAVRSFRGAEGQGWWPRPGMRVVAEDASLADEAELFAGEVGGTATRGTERDVRAGDIRLALDKGEPAEGYRLDSRGGRLVITGGTDAGVFYGTRTAVQSVRARGLVPSGTAEDRPDRPQRGLMVDIARKHYSKDWLLARVREMGDLKLNQLHLHISDDQGFRVESTSHPEVVSQLHLSKRDVREIVAAADARHITVFPEIDSPGHLGAVLRAHPEFQLKNASGVAITGAVDISKPGAGALVDDLYREYADLFPGKYLHLGGDEYRALMASDPAASYPQLAAYARERYGPGATVADAANGWLNDRADTARKLGKTVKAWNDGFVTGSKVSPGKDREVEYWTGREYGQRDPAAFLREGRTLVNLNDEYLYYVLGQPNAFTYPTGERIYREWSPAVVRGSTAVPDDLAGPDRVLGARFAVWGDYPNAQTETQVAKGIRMPLRALAQRTWDPVAPAQPWAAFTELAARVDRSP